MLPLKVVLSSLRRALYNVNIASKIIIPFIGLAALIAIAGGYTVAVWATDYMDSAARTSIIAATTATNQTFALYENQTSVYAKALSEASGLAANLRSGDISTVRQILLPDAVTFNSDFFEVLNADGIVVLNNSGPYQNGVNLSDLSLVKNARVDLRWVQLAYTPVGYAITGVAPIKDENGRAGFVLLGDFANTAFLDRIKRVSGQDISLFNESSLIATTRRDHWQTGCSTGGCHKEGFAGAISKQTKIGTGTPDIADMLGHSYMINHGTLTLSGEPAAFYTVLMSLDATIRTQNIIKGTVFLLSAMLLILITGLGFFISKGIASPLRQLSIIAKQVARGDLTPRADYPGTKDEVGELALSFNMMTESLQRYTTNLRKRLLELSILYETSVSTRSIYKLGNLLELIIQNAAKAVNADSGCLFLLDDSGTSLKLQAGYNIPASLIGKITFDVETGASSLSDKRLKHIGGDIQGTLQRMSAATASLREDKALLLTRQDADDKTKQLLIEAKSSSLLSMPLKTHDSILGAMNLERGETKVPFADEDRNFIMTMASQAAAYIENRKLIDNLRDSYIATVRALATAIDAKDHYTRGHSTRVARFSVAIAQELKLPDSDIEGIETAAYLHDVGKIGVSDQILMKPGKLTLEEMETVRTHPKIGAKILSPINFPWEIVPIVFQHHERYSGGGYPNKLAYDDIHIGARILIVADSYEAMTSERPYRAALTRQAALEELRKGSGTQFDPMVVEAFIRVLDRGLDLEPADEAEPILQQ